MTALKVAYVLGTTEGGTGRHVAMLTAGLRGAAADGGAGQAVTGVRIFGPAPARPLFDLAGAVPARFDDMPIADRPRPARDMRTVLRLRRAVREFGAGIVHAHGLRAGALAALALRPGWRGGNQPALVVTVHNAPPDAGRLAMIYRVLERVVARYADAVLCVSPDLTLRMRELGAASVGSAVVPSPVSPAAGAAANASAAAGSAAGQPAGDGRPVVLAAGRLAPQKRFDVLLLAAARPAWRDRQPPPLVLIAGAGPLAGYLSALARDLGVDARLLGTRDDVPELLAAADVFVLPSQWEGQPLILQEALRAGRPIVASDVPGVRALAGDDGALFVAPGDPEALSQAVLAVLDDPPLAGRLASAAAARAAELPAEADAVRAVLGLYHRLARSRGTSAGTGATLSQ